MSKNLQIENFITLETLNDASLFAIYGVDLESFQVVYTNQKMKNLMADMTAEKCWESIYGNEEQCVWCKKNRLLKGFQSDISLNDKTKNHIIYEHFNEFANGWFQIQEMLVLVNDRKILVSFWIDIAMQKDSQQKLIDAQVRLRQQTTALKDMQKKLQIQANKDHLTQLYNRRYFQDISKELISLSYSDCAELSLLIIDIDKFKNINDTYGHSAGDEVIKAISYLLQTTTRDIDIVTRFGGEEFAILLPKTGIGRAKIVANKIRRAIEDIEVKFEKLTIKCTISIGISKLYHLTDTIIDDIVKRADTALYEAKEAGRNCVKIYEKD